MSAFLERPEVQPWARRNVMRTLMVVIASVVPAAFTLLVMQLAAIDSAIALVAIFLPLQLVAAGAVGFKFFGKRGFADSWLIVLSVFLSAVVFVLLIAVLYSVIVNGFLALSPQFIYQNNRYISTTTSLEYGGVGHAILGTMQIVLLTTVIAVPLGIAMAIYLTLNETKGKGTIRVFTQALSGLPSVVSGLFILALISMTGIEKSGLTGALALFPLMLPTVARVAEESIRLVPADLRLAALALGAPNYRTFFQVVLPAAKSGLITALLLGLARVIGETAPLILTLNANNTTNLNVFAGGMASLPTYIYGFIAGGYASSTARAWGAALVLLILVGVFFVAARVLTRSKTAKTSKRGSKK